MDRKFQNKLQDLLNNYETKIKQAIKQNKIPELATWQAAVNNLKFILENYKNKAPYEECANCAFDYRHCEGVVGRKFCVEFEEGEKE